MLSKLIERVMYEGYTYEELCIAAGGGGKEGGGEVRTPPPLQTTTAIGSQLDPTAKTFEEEIDKTKAVDIKKLGTRGLQIPLTADTSTTSTPSGGVQL